MISNINSSHRISTCMGMVGELKQSRPEVLRGVSCEAQKANRITSRVPSAFRGQVIA